MTGVGDQSDGVQKIVDDDWLVDVEFEVALRSGEAHGRRRTMQPVRRPWSWPRTAWGLLCLA